MVVFEFTFSLFCVRSTCPGEGQADLRNSGHLSDARGRAAGKSGALKEKRREIKRESYRAGFLEHFY